MSTQQNILIVGASRGLGLGYARHYLKAGAAVVATARQPAKAGDLSALKADSNGRLTVEALELTDAAAGDALAERLKDHRFDAIILNAGVFGPQDQSPAALTAAQVAEVMTTNAFAPVRLAGQLVPLAKPGAAFVFMTSLMGSIAENTSGGADLYRSSKAALNMLTRNFHLGHRGHAVIAMHPGWVKTDMGGPQAPLDIDTSVAGMIKAIAAHAAGGGHHYLDYTGKALPW